MMFKRNEIRISRFFYKMSDFPSNEIFSAWPFIMLWIDGGWPEKLTRNDRSIAKW